MVLAQRQTNEIEQKGQKQILTYIQSNDFQQGFQDHSVGKGLFSTINVRKIVYPHAREKKLMDPHLIQQTKTNSEMEKDLNLRCKIIKNIG